MPPRLQQILSELRAGLEALYGPRLERLVLYGSQARGDAAPDSDIDVLVVLAGEVEVGKELWRISEVTTELSLAHATVISTVVMSAAQYLSRRSGFLSSMQQEGRPI